jgi:hypothetical protein
MTALIQHLACMNLEKQISISAVLMHARKEERAGTKTGLWTPPPRTEQNLIYHQVSKAAIKQDEKGTGNQH